MAGLATFGYEHSSQMAVLLKHYNFSPFSKHVLGVLIQIAVPNELKIYFGVQIAICLTLSVPQEEMRTFRLVRD